MAGVSLNRVFLAGNLTRDPELRYTPSGMAVADLGLAINESFKSSDGQRQDRAIFVDVTVWDRMAENCCEYLSKGRPVLVEGRLQMDTWETNDGQKRSKLKVTALRVQFLGAPPQRQGEGAPAARPASARPAARPAARPGEPGAPAAPAAPPPAEPEPPVQEPVNDLPPAEGGSDIPF